MGAGLQILGWIGIVCLLLLSVRLVGEGADFWEKAFRNDYEREVCGRWMALDANLKSAVAMWRKMGCAGEEEVRAEDEIADVIEEWRGRYGDVDMEACEGVRLHRERNPDLDAEYPNWVVRYE